MLVEVCDAQPRYIKLGGYELNLENDSSKGTITKREVGEEKEITYKLSDI